MEGLKRIGLFGISLPTEFGGMGLSQSAYCRVFEFVTGYDVGLAIVLGVHLSIGIKGIQLAGTTSRSASTCPKRRRGSGSPPLPSPSRRRGATPTASAPAHSFPTTANIGC
jgi:alkylation response protein AidB-like acyl-CoA dehydrogenase